MTRSVREPLNNKDTMRESASASFDLNKGDEYIQFERNSSSKSFNGILKNLWHLELFSFFI